MDKMKTTPENDRAPPQESEFGEGFAYCLGLFLAHEFRIHEYRKINKQTGRRYMDASSWFNGAADHLYGLVAPSSFSDHEKKELENWQDQCLRFRLCMNGETCTFDDALAATQKAKDMLLDWDRRNGIPAIKGSWE